MIRSSPVARCSLVAFALLAVSLSFDALAQNAAPQPPPPAPAATAPARPGAAQPRGNDANPSATAERPRLPPDSTTKQSITLPGRTLSFSATAGSIRLFNDKNEPQVDIAYTAYQLDGADAATRPVTFFVNGGPGASSAWLQFGAAGPWRLPIGADAALPSASPELQPNAETWLDFSDLVFIDPVGTGYSRFIASGDDVHKRFYSVDGDIASIALTIRRWLERSNRLTSPKFVVGESYGGFRGPRIVQNLQMDQGVGVKGLILVSPLLDYREFSGTSILQYVGSLPTMAAIAREKKGPVTRADMAEVETYARGEYLADVMKGLADAEATTRLADKVAALTGIDQALSRRLAGRFETAEFRREFDRRNGRIAGRYDGSISGYDPYPDSSYFIFGDPSGDTLQAPLTSAAVDLYTRKLNWRPDGSYEVLNGAVGRAWDFGSGMRPPESLSQLRQILARDPKLKLLVAHGLFDLATPYFATKIAIDQLPDFTRSDRAKFVVYSGGHMFYARDGSRQALRADAQAMMK
jgi:carboxypeptidase C (cathepsin A)